MRVGKRDGVSAYEFIGDLHSRIAETHRCQITTDGLEGYIPAAEEPESSRRALHGVV